MNWLYWMDTAVLAFITGCTIDASRLVQPYREPLRSMTYAVMAVGTFGYSLTRPGHPSGWELIMHVGVAGYVGFNLLRLLRSHAHYHHPLYPPR